MKLSNELESIMLLTRLAYRHSSVRNNLKLSTNGRAKIIVGKIDGSSLTIGEDIFSIKLIDSCYKEKFF